jgi:osmotically-inducible protein OsmY
MTVERTQDAEIQQRVLRELKWDTRVEATEVGVEVHDRIVTLTGTVSSWAKRIAAQDAARRVAGVFDVANDIAVNVPGSALRTDTDIAHAVRRALEWHALVPDERIRTTVSDGRVTLEGDVDCWSEREDAENAVQNLAGVRSVVNEIAVVPPRTVAFDVEGAIQSALERQAEREARRIVVEFAGGHVTLRGSVRSWAERQAVIGAARGTRGVKSVDSKLAIVG